MAALWLGLASVAWAQEEAPQVLTSDLALKQEIETSRITVNFVIVDDDNITKVKIDGEEQKIIPGDTVLITKEFVFTKGRHIIRVVVEDEEGNKRERSYLVAYGVPLELTAEEEKDEGIKFGFVFDVRYEVDDNPTQDLSLPFTIDEIGEVEGVIDDSEQEDNRTVLKALVTAAVGNSYGYAGFVDTHYEKKVNKLLNSRALFLGGTQKFGERLQWILGGTLTDVDLGGKDYALQFTVSPGYQTRGRDSEDEESFTILYGLNVTSKSFADGTREDGIESEIKRAYSSVDNDKLDTYKSLLSLGTRTEGTPESEFTFFRSDFDWANKWNSGVKWDIGFGYQYRDYSNDKDVITDDSLFGDTRVDHVLHFTTGVGMDFGQLALMFNYRYVTDLSNDSPYVRQIYGLSLQGAF